MSWHAFLVIYFSNARLPNIRPAEFYKVPGLRFDIYKLSFLSLYLLYNTPEES
jgi:hypothetical protein